MKAMIFDVKRFAVHDGDGIRTAVFLKGCPLRCAWCHNPEGLSAAPQLAFYAEKCTGCRMCAQVCPHAAQDFSGNAHRLVRSACVSCGKCVSVCAAGALQQYGREMTVEELLPVLEADRAFYENSGGGVTLSGGECLLYPDFCAQLLERLKRDGISTAVDTCGFVPRSALEKVMPYTDCFLYDVKAFSETVHQRCTGQFNQKILENLRFLDGAGKRTEIRIPFVPGWNDGEVEAIGQFLSMLHHVTGVRVLPYHAYAASKYAALDIPSALPPVMPTREALEQAVRTLERHHLPVQRI